MTASPDVFLSYSREDHLRAKSFADAFSNAGLNVWWDMGLRAGEAYDEVTETALRSAKAVVVLWSKASVASRWVRAEATLADRNKTLVPAMIEPCERPIMFELTQTAELSHWKGDKTDPAFCSFLEDLRRHVGQERETTRPRAPLTTDPAAHETGPPRLAVLPFTNRSGLAEDDILAEGIVEDITACLATARNLAVIASGSTAIYRKQTYDVQEIGRTLGARYLLEGNTRRAGDHLRVTAQLVETRSGVIIWSEKFDRPLRDLACLQEDVASEVAARLGTHIEGVEAERVLRKASNLSVWEALLRAGIAQSRRQLAEAMHFSQKALELEPGNARAHSALSVAVALGGITLDTGNRLEEGLAHAERALQIDPQDPEVLRQAGVTLYLCGEIDRGYACVKRARDLMPGAALMHQSYAHACVATNRIAEGHEAVRTFDRLAPRSAFRATTLVAKMRLHLAEDRLEEARATLHELTVLAPGDSAAQFDGAIVLGRMGQMAQAQNALRRYRNNVPSRTLQATAEIIRRTRPRSPFLQDEIRVLAEVWTSLEAQPS